MLPPTVRPRVAVGPGAVLVDEPVPVRVDGVAPGRTVRVNTASLDGDGNVHEAWAEFAADANGSVRPEGQAPIRGTYDGIDPYGLWWSMRAPAGRPFGSSLEAVPTTVTVAVAGEVIAWHEIERLRVAPGVRVEPLRSDGLRGLLCSPARLPAAGVIVLGGSEGGLSQAAQIAALMAARGTVALALAYFGVDGLPAHLAEIPIEYVERAVDHLRWSEAIAGSTVGLVGTSRGAELALLVASCCARIGALVGFSASSIAWSSVAPGRPRAAWTRRGVPVPHAVPADGFAGALDDVHTRERARIPVERIACPVLLCSGADDRLWPSERFGELVMRALRGTSHRHHVYAGAGHAFLRPPALPAAPTSTTSPMDGSRLALGGSPRGNAYAAAAAWPRALGFLRDALAS